MRTVCILRCALTMVVLFVEVLAITSSATPALAQQCEEQKLTASDREAGDRLAPSR